MDKMAIRKRIANATVSKGGNFFRDGRGRVALREFELSGGHKGEKAVFRFVVVSSAKVNVFSEKQNRALDVLPNAPGTGVSAVWKLNQDVAWGKIKGTVLALFNEPDANEADLLDTLTEMEERGAAYGRVVDYETRRVITEKKGIEIVVVDWFPVEQSDEDILKTRAWIDSLKLTKSESEDDGDAAA